MEPGPRRKAALDRGSGSEARRRRAVETFPRIVSLRENRRGKKCPGGFHSRLAGMAGEASDKLDDVGCDIGLRGGDRSHSGQQVDELGLRHPWLQQAAWV
jgi:hypothetical protein